MAPNAKRSKKVSDTAASAKLLDAWLPPPGAGEPRGCLATSFTFNAAFFEEECLGRFVGLDADASDQPVAFLVEREEKLAQVYAGALVDRHHCKGMRSLRWDLMPVRVPGGIQHSKIALLHWASVVRVIVASANLTEDGYRRNREVFGVVDFRPDAAAPRALLAELITFLRELLQPAYTQTDAAAAERAAEFIANLGATVASWPLANRAAPSLQPVFVAPRRPGAIAQLAAAWPSAAGVPHRVDVLSPFFDPSDTDASAPTVAVCRELLRKRGGATLGLHVEADVRDGHAHVAAPPSVLGSVGAGVETSLAVVASEDSRPLHAKSLLIESERALGLLIGSSNFTTAGLGLRADAGTGTNFEANLLYLINLERDGQLRARVGSAFLAGTPLAEGITVSFRPSRDMAEDGPPPDAPPLPVGFRTAVLMANEAGALFLRLCIAQPPADWRIYVYESDDLLCSSTTVATHAADMAIDFPWAAGKRPPSGLTIEWGEPARRAWWPVTTESLDTLPPVEELRNLPLEVLLEVLTSARPLYRNEALLRHLGRALLLPDSHAGPKDLELDPHRRVDTSSFLMQRTRRVGWGLAGLRERLERPVLSKEALNWRLRGPWGPLALADAIRRDAEARRQAGAAATETEEAFLIAELMMELSRLTPAEHEHTLPARVVRQALRGVIAELRQRLPAQPASPTIAAYIAAVCEELRA